MPIDKPEAPPQHARMLGNLFGTHSEDLSADERALLEQLEKGDEELAASRHSAAASRIAEDVHMRGRLVSRGSLHLDGNLEGNATAGDTIVVEPAGHVVGDLSAVDVVINGRVSGNIRARRRLELAAGAQLSGHLLEQPEVLVIHEKARFGEGA